MAISMSRTRLISTLTAGLVLLAAASWFVTAAFPLAAEPQVVADGAGVTVELSGAQLMHRSPVRYPVDAIARRVEGSVAVQVRLAADGTVMDANIVSGPDELRKAVLESVLNWHFAKDTANPTRMVTVSFQLPARAQVALVQGITPQLREYSAPASSPSHIVSIEVRGLSDQARSDLLAALPVHVGDAFSPDATPKVLAAALAFDQHLRVSSRTNQKGETTITIALPEAAAVSPAGGSVTISQNIASPVAAAEGATPRVQMGGNVMAAMLIYGPRPQYPELAKQARISGVVHLHAFIAADGTVQSLTVIPPAHPLLAPAAVEAVRTWRYKPTLLNGQPVEVETTIEVSFMIAEQQPESQPEL